MEVSDGSTVAYVDYIGACLAFKERLVVLLHNDVITKDGFFPKRKKLTQAKVHTLLPSDLLCIPLLPPHDRLPRPAPLLLTTPLAPPVQHAPVHRRLQASRRPRVGESRRAAPPQARGRQEARGVPARAWRRTWILDGELGG